MHSNIPMLISTHPYKKNTAVLQRRKSLLLHSYNRLTLAMHWHICSNASKLSAGILKKIFLHGRATSFWPVYWQCQRTGNDKYRLGSRHDSGCHHNPPLETLSEVPCTRVQKQWISVTLEFMVHLYCFDCFKLRNKICIALRCMQKDSVEADRHLSHLLLQLSVQITNLICFHHQSSL